MAEKTSSATGPHCAAAVGGPGDTVIQMMNMGFSFLDSIGLTYKVSLNIRMHIAKSKLLVLYHTWSQENQDGFPLKNMGNMKKMLFKKMNEQNE